MTERTHPLDIVSTAPSGAEWIVCAFFTPDYRPLAERLAADLARHHAPYHLFACAASERSIRQTTRRRPEFILRAMDRYPEKKIVFMDADCRVRFGISYLAERRADVAHYMKAVPSRKLSQWRRMRFGCCDRVMVFAPTEGARNFVTAWEAEGERNDIPRKGGSEWIRSHAMVRTTGVTFEQLPSAYSGVELNRAAVSDVIVHDSEYRRRKKAGWLSRERWRRWGDMARAVMVILFIVPLLRAAGALDDDEENETQTVK